MSYWYHLRDDVVIFGVLFLLVIMYLFYVRYPYNRETDNEKSAPSFSGDTLYT